MKKWNKKKLKEIYEGRIFSLKQQECFHPKLQVEHDFFILETYDWINVVATTEDNKIIFVKQHRLGTDEITLETPGGIIEKNEDAFDTAKRELLEETGYSSNEIILLKKLSVNPAILNNYIHFYYAPNCKKVSEQQLDLAEDIEVLLYKQNEVIEMIQSGTINHSIIITALSLFFLSPYCRHRNISLL